MFGMRKDKNGALFYCRETMFSSSPIRETTPHFEVAKGDWGGKWHSHFGNQNGGFAIRCGGACPVPYGASLGGTKRRNNKNAKRQKRRFAILSGRTQFAPTVAIEYLRKGKANKKDNERRLRNP